MSFPLYTAFYSTALLATAPVHLARGLKSGKYFWSLKARLGLDPGPVPAKKTRRAWVHALSLGEVLAAVPLVESLEREGWEVLFSTTTKSGHEIAASRLGRLFRLCYPFDFPSSVSRLLDRADPDLFVLMETDIWPNFLAEAGKRNIPAVLAGARVSPRSLSGYRLARGFWGRVLRLFHFIGCQSELDRTRMLALGADPARTVVTGNLKFDRPAPPVDPEARAAFAAETGLPDGPWLVGGSTHPGEEDALLDAYLGLLPEFPDLKLLLAPRNRPRFEEVWELIGRRGLVRARRTDGRPPAGVQVFLLDTLGELDRFYEPADLVFMGKSLPGADEGGGHNLIEPAARGKPLVFGPRMQNFVPLATMMLDAGAGRQVADRFELARAIGEILASPGRRAAMGEAARAATASHRGAVERTMALIREARP
ncbi:MAG: 3-deoxy-D-manno-octulosonic acid transferase [Pseudomonadota bacterium]